MPRTGSVDSNWTSSHPLYLPGEAGIAGAVRDVRLDGDPVADLEMADGGVHSDNLAVGPMTQDVAPPRSYGRCSRHARYEDPSFDLTSRLLPTWWSQEDERSLPTDIGASNSNTDLVGFQLTARLDALNRGLSGGHPDVMAGVSIDANVRLEGCLDVPDRGCIDC
ncbi:hypothetical protein FOBRF1_006878 [Fusarium oxysporum]